MAVCTTPITVSTQIATPMTVPSEIYGSIRGECYTPKTVSTEIATRLSVDTIIDMCSTLGYCRILRGECYTERWGAGVETHFKKIHETYAPS